MLSVITISNIINQELTPLGITIFDISNLSQVSYCFVHFKRIGRDREVPLMTPLSGRTYLEAYDDLADPENSEDLLPLVKSFQGWDMIPASVLEDVWPGEGWKEAKTDIEEGEGEEPDLRLEQPEIGPSAGFVTLRGQTMDTVIQNLLDSPEENLGLVAEAEELTDFLPRLKNKLYDVATTMKWSSHHLDLLYQALKNEVEVNLSPLSDIPAKDLAIIVAKLYENGKMRVLNLSHRPDISLEDLRSIIGTGTRLRVLCLLEMPQIPLESLGQYLVNCEIHHSDLLRWALRDYSFFKGRNPQERMPNTVFPATGVVSQIVWTGLGITEIKDRLNYLPNGRIAWENLRFNPSRQQREPVICFCRGLLNMDFDLCMPVAPCKLVPGVLRLLQWAGSVQLTTTTQVSQGIAFSLASSLPCTNGTGHGISVLNPSLYVEPKIQEWEWPRAQSRPFSLNVGEWALFLIGEAFDVGYRSFSTFLSNDEKELSSKDGETKSGNFAQAPEADPAAPKDRGPKFCPRKATSYALVTCVAGPGPSQYMVVDMPTFLEKVLGETSETRELIKTWSSGISSIKNAEFFGDDTYKILEKLSPEASTPERKEAQGAKQGAEHDGTGSI